MLKINITNDNDVNTRLDIFLSNQLTEHTRSYIKNLISDGKVLVNDKLVKAGYQLKLNDIIVVSMPPSLPKQIQPQNIKLDIVYEDSDLLVINKKQGMVVHPAIKNYENTLVNALLFHVKDLSKVNGELRPGIIHRLDKDTSGLIIIAKNDVAHINLSKQIANKSCKRYYMALCDYALKDDKGEIITQIGRHPKNRLKMAVLESGGKLAHTKYKILKNYNQYSLVECELVTGRTHQIRVHMAHINHAIIGDKLYNTKPSKFKLNGQLLHAYKLEFTQPTTKLPIKLECELPNYFKQVLNVIK